MTSIVKAPFFCFSNSVASSELPTIYTRNPLRYESEFPRTLPKEIILTIFSFLNCDFKEFLSIRLTCKTFCFLATATIGSLFDRKMFSASLKTCHLESVKFLIRSSLFVDPASQNSEALSLAIEQGDAAFVRELLNNPRICPYTRNNFPLKLACETGNEEIVKMLLADLRMSLRDQSMSLGIAAKKGYVRIVQLLLKAGVDPMREWDGRDINAPIYQALAKGHQDVYEVLIADSRVANKIHLKELFISACKGAAMPVIETLLHKKNICTEGWHIEIGIARAAKKNMFTSSNIC